MKKVTFIVAMLVGLLTATAQDLIIKKSGTELKVKVSEITDTHIKYKLQSSPTGPIYSVKKDEVAAIKYEDGNVDVFTGADTKDMYAKGVNDAEKYYKAYKEASTGVLVSSILFSPLLGLIPAVATSATAPADDKLNYPSSELMSNADYARGYKSKAKSIKSNKVWLNWSVGLLTMVVFVAATAN